MAGIDVGLGVRTRRRSLDSEINMIPMIDLLMVTISFLLITAVWSHMARLNADAQVPGHDGESKKLEPEKRLYIEMRSPDRFVLAWKQGLTTVDSFEVPRLAEVSQQGAVQVIRFPDLAAKIESEWKAKGQHTNPTDTQLDQAVLVTDNKTEFRYIVAVIDAVYQTKREFYLGAKPRKISAFNMSFATD